MNTHLEAFSSDGTRKRQIDIVEETLNEMSTQGQSWIIGGDFNTLPNYSETLVGFPDACAGMFEEDTYEGEEDWMDSMFASFNSAMDLDEYREDNSSWFTYTGDVCGVESNFGLYLYQWRMDRPCTKLCDAIC